MDGREIKEIRSADTERAQRLPPGQREVDEPPVLHEGRTPEVDLTSWTFTISGLVEQERRLSYDEFRSLPRVRVFADLHCVEGWSKLNNTWEGVSSQTLKSLVKILPEARFALVHCLGKYTTNLTLDDFFQDDVLFADRQDGRAMPPERGFPLRLIVPRLYFWKSAKWVVGVEFRAEDQPGFWESRGYHNHGDPWKEERFSRD